MKALNRESTRTAQPALCRANRHDTYPVSSISLVEVLQDHESPLCFHLLFRHNSCSDLGRKESAMLYYALVFLIVGLIAGALGIYGVAAVASQIAWVLFLIGIVLLVVHLVSGRTRPIL